MKFGGRCSERSWGELEGEGKGRYDEDTFYTCITFPRSNLKFKKKKLIGSSIIGSSTMGDEL